MRSNRVFTRYFCFLAALSSAWGAFGTALDDYVAAPDPSYSYTISSSQHAEVSGVGYTRYVIRMTSQTWRTSSEMNRTAWEHWLTLAIPDVPASNKALLVINGGSNGNPATSLSALAMSFPRPIPCSPFSNRCPTSRCAPSKTMSRGLKTN